jgi:putative hydrolase of the HAD superfamily
MQYLTARSNDASLAAIFFDLDGTLCLPTLPFKDIFGTVVRPMLQRHAGLTLADLLRRWGEALLQPGPSTSAGCLR